jgi:hypothetical protein
MGRRELLESFRSVTRLRPLARLRLAFVLLAVLLLLPLALLLNAANERLEAQRLLRHQVVAERVFDELERELTLLLESESQRPSSAYAQDTSVGAWAPFIVGYFIVDSAGTRYAAEDQLQAVRRARLDAALSEWHSGETAEPEKASQFEETESIPSLPPSVGSRDADTLEDPAAKPGRVLGSSSGAEVKSRRPILREKAAAARAPRSSPEVLRQLNRADEQRRQQAAPKGDDPLRDYGY